MKRHVTLSALAVAFLLPLSLLGNEKTKPSRADDLDKKVVDIVKKTGDLYKDAKSLHVEGTIVSKADDADKETKVSAIYDVAKPNQLALSTKVDGDANKGPNVVADGKNLYVYAKGNKQYMEKEQPGTLGEVGLSLLGLRPAFAGMLFANILGDDPADLLMQGVTNCSYVGMEKVDGTPVHRMKFSQPEFDWELWVAAEGKPYVLRMISTSMGVKVTETYKNWKLNEAPAKELFTFKAPEGVTKVENFGEPANDK